jgi:ubiquitin-protein ligase E3 B
MKKNRIPKYFIFTNACTATERLPSASTCFNVLKLPNYKRSATMKAKVKYAVTSGAGFELS